jgi:hypothetical protein
MNIVKKFARKIPKSAIVDDVLTRHERSRVASRFLIAKADQEIDRIGKALEQRRVDTDGAECPRP